MSRVLNATYYDVSEESWGYIKFYNQPIDVSDKDWDDYISTNSKDSAMSKRVMKEFSETPLYFYGTFSELKEAHQVLLKAENPCHMRIEYYEMILAEWRRDRKYRYIRFEN